MTQDNKPAGRAVVANISLSLDGRVTGPGGEADMGWVAGHAVTDAARELQTRMTNTATTALLGRKNYVGFGSFWPAVATDESADPRDRALARWLDAVEKVAFSTTLEEPSWANSRIVNDDPVTVVEQLRREDGGDIIVLNSVSIINQLLHAGQVDRLSLVLCPEIPGGGTRLFDDGLPGTSWSLTDMMTSDSGAICLYYDRIRDAG